MKSSPDSGMLSSMETTTPQGVTVKKQEKPAVEFTRTREFIARYSVVDDQELDVLAVWAIGTWTFSPACVWPATYPYLYITGPAGSGKSVLGMDSLGSVCRRHSVATGATGSTLFRMLGEFNEETGEIDNYAPTLVMDEIDATFSGQKDEPLRLSLNVGYKKSGSTIPRVSGKTSIDFPVYGPKLLMGIDNGHLPETVTQRSIRINLVKQTGDQLAAAGIEDFYSWDVADESAELQEQLAAWAKVNSHVLREYRPARPAGLTARQWEIGRSLVQLANALGIEQRITASLLDVLSRNPERPDGKVQLYQVISDLFDELDTDRITSAAILAKLTENDVRVPGQSGKGLAAVLSEDSIAATLVHLPAGHPLMPENGQSKQRGYWRHMFDGPFLRYLHPED